MQLSDNGQIDVPCPLSADLTGDCHVKMDDFSILASQWQQTGDPVDCLLTADLAGGDCHITLEDILIMASQWLE